MFDSVSVEMAKKRSSKSAAAILSLVSVGLVIGFAGCNSKVDLRDVHNSNIKKLHVCYMMYMSQNGMKGPEDDAQLKEFLASDPTAAHLMKKIDLTPDNVGEVFVSERDGEPFVLRFGVKGPSDHAVIFEATGVDGKRMVALANPIELNEADYQAYLSGKKQGEKIGTGADSEN